MAADSTDGWSPSRFGSAIRTLRVSRGLSVTELARRSDLSQSFLSQVEIGRSDISVSRLVRLAQALDVRLDDLVDQRSHSADQVVRADERVELPAPSEGMRLYLLAPSLDSGRTNGLGCLEPGAVAGPIYSKPGSESFVYLLEGIAQIDLSGGRMLTLNPGDSARYRAYEFEGMTNPHDSRCVFLWIQAVPRLDGQ
jgi:transcriptional regulator with XRE-family HTH domain